MDPQIFSNQHKTAKIILVILGVSVVGFSIWVWRTSVMLNRQNAEMDANKNKAEYQTRLKVSQQDIDKSQFPVGLSKDLPIEAGAEVVSNFTASAVTGTSQATRAYKSKLSLDQLETDYALYLKNDGWKVFPTTKNKSNWGFSAQKDGALFQINLSQLDKESVLVILTYIPALKNSK